VFCSGDVALQQKPSLLFVILAFIEMTLFATTSFSGNLTYFLKTSNIGCFSRYVYESSYLE